MLAIIRQPWLYKLNQVNSQLLMPFMAVTFLLFNTVVNLWIGERAETLQNILAICILFVFACNIMCDPITNSKIWIRNNTFVLVYLVARLISLWQADFNYSVIRTIFFEVFFIIGINRITIGDSGKKYVNMFLWIELIFTSVSLFIYYFLQLFCKDVPELFLEYTYIDKSGNALMFSNPNTAGIMAGAGIILAMILYGKNGYKRIYMAAFGIYNVIALILFGCRSADVGVLLAIGTFLIIRTVSIDKRKITIIILSAMIAVLIPIYAMVEYNESISHLSYTKIEEKVDNISSGRYTLWKQCILTQQDSLFFGKGNLALEQDARKEMMESLEKRWEYSYRYFSAAELGPHNGYIGMVSATGWVGFILFIAILFQRIKKAVYLKNGNWYLMLVFIFVINCFESLFILNRFFTCFYMFLILETDMDGGKKVLRG